MSVETMAIALHHSKAKGTAKVILLGIANHDGDGGAWPSLATLARYANVDRSTAKRAIDRLEALGEVVCVVGAGGDHSTADYFRPNLYRVTLECPPDCDRKPQHRTRRQRALTPLLPDPVAPVHPGAPVQHPVAPVTRGEGAPTPPEPSLEPEKKRSTRATTDRARGNCGHDLIDATHCLFGCRLERVVA